MAYTVPEDVIGRWLFDDAPPDAEVLEVHIDDAEDTIISAVPDLDERITDGRLREETLVKIVSRMVIRHLRNPEGIRQESETTGPYNATRTYGGDEPGAIYLSKRDRRELLGVRKGKAFMIDTMPAHVHRHPRSHEWC